MTARKHHTCGSTHSPKFMSWWHNHSRYHRLNGMCIKSLITQGGTRFKFHEVCLREYTTYMIQSISANTISSTMTLKDHWQGKKILTGFGGDVTRLLSKHQRDMMITNVRSQVMLEMRVLLCKGFDFDVLFALIWLFSFWVYLLSEITYGAWGSVLRSGKCLHRIPGFW